MLLSLLSTRVAFLTGRVARTLVAHNVRPMPARALASPTVAVDSLRNYSSAADTTAKEPSKAKKASAPKSKQKDGKAKMDKKEKKTKKAAEKEKKEKIKVTKEDLPPKKPPSAFILFFQHKFRTADIPEGMSKVEFAQSTAKEASAEWKSMTLQDKAEYINRCQAARAEYKEKYAQYLRDVDLTKLKEINRIRKNKGKPRIVVASPVENRRPVTAFLRFLKMYRKDKPADMPTIDCAVEASRAWNAMTAEEKLPYITEFRDAMDAWKAKNTQL